MSEARGDFIMIQAADFEYDPFDVPELYRAPHAPRSVQPAMQAASKK